MIGQEETASSCARAGSDWILAKISSPKGLSSIGTSCPGKWLSHHPWRHFKDLWMWCLGTWFGGGLSSIRFTGGLDDLKGLFQPDSMVLLGDLVVEKLKSITRPSEKSVHLGVHFYLKRFDIQSEPLDEIIVPVMSVQATERKLCNFHHLVDLLRLHHKKRLGCKNQSRHPQTHLHSPKSLFSLLRLTSRWHSCKYLPRVSPLATLISHMISNGYHPVLLGQIYSLIFELSHIISLGHETHETHESLQE